MQLRNYNKIYEFTNIITSFKKLKLAPSNAQIVPLDHFLEFFKKYFLYF